MSLLLSKMPLRAIYMSTSNPSRGRIIVRRNAKSNQRETNNVVAIIAVGRREKSGPEESA
jgi:hypothetical protein